MPVALVARPGRPTTVPGPPRRCTARGLGKRACARVPALRALGTPWRTADTLPNFVLNFDYDLYDLKIFPPVVSYDFDHVGLSPLSHGGRRPWRGGGAEARPAGARRWWRLRASGNVLRHGFGRWRRDLGSWWRWRRRWRWWQAAACAAAAALGAAATWHAAADAPADADGFVRGRYPPGRWLDLRGMPRQRLRLSQFALQTLVQIVRPR